MNYRNAELTSLTILCQRKHLSVKQAKEIVALLGLRLVRWKGKRQHERKVPLPFAPKFARCIPKPRTPRPFRPKPDRYLLPDDVARFLHEYYRQLGEKALSRVR